MGWGQGWVGGWVGRRGCEWMDGGMDRRKDGLVGGWVGLGCVGLGRYPEAENNSETKKTFRMRAREHGYLGCVVRASFPQGKPGRSSRARSYWCNLAANSRCSKRFDCRGLREQFAHDPRLGFKISYSIFRVQPHRHTVHPCSHGDHIGVQNRRQPLFNLAIMGCLQVR
jgi:hypothetical protein